MSAARKQEVARDAGASAAGEEALVKTLTALSDPLRLEIIRRLDAGGPMSCNELQLAVPLPTLSRHLNILREAGIVLTVPDGTRRVNSLRRQELEQRFPGLFSTVLRLARLRTGPTHSRRSGAS